MKIPLTKNIEKYQSKVFLGLSARQIVATLLGFAAGAGVYALLGAAPLAVRTAAAAIVGIPIVMVGMLTYGGMSSIQLLKKVMKSNRYKYEEDEGDFLDEKEK